MRNGLPAGHTVPSKYYSSKYITAAFVGLKYLCIIYICHISNAVFAIFLFVDQWVLGIMLMPNADTIPTCEISK